MQGDSNGYSHAKTRSLPFSKTIFPNLHTFCLRLTVKVQTWNSKCNEEKEGTKKKKGKQKWPPYLCSDVWVPYVFLRGVAWKRRIGERACNGDAVPLCAADFGEFATLLISVTYASPYDPLSSPTFEYWHFWAPPPFYCQKLFFSPSTFRFPLVSSPTLLKNTRLSQCFP